MSNSRGTVEIWNHAAAPKSEERPVVLYTHWGASTLINDVMTAMQKRERWKDPAYLSRMIFCHMLCGDLSPLDGTAGYGILTDNVTDTVMEIVIDCDRQEVIVKELNRDNEKYSFDEFVELTNDTPTFIDKRAGDRRQNERRDI